MELSASEDDRAPLITPLPANNSITLISTAYFRFTLYPTPPPRVAHTRSDRAVTERDDGNTGTRLLCCWRLLEVQ